MCPKKLEIDNRNKKTPLIHRFMTSNSPTDSPLPAEENTYSAKETESDGVEKDFGEIPENISEDNPPQVQNITAEKVNGELIVTEVTAPPTDDVSSKEDEAEPIKEDENTSNQNDQNEDFGAPVAEYNGKDEESAEMDYKNFITDIQDKIASIKNLSLQSREDMKAQIKAELREEIRNELREEAAAKEKAVELRIVREPVKATSPLVEKAGEARYIFRNTMEDIVAEEVMSILKNEKNMCKCSRCVNDICAIVLNALPPHYVTSEVGQIYDRAGLLDITKLSNLTANIFKAVDQVKNKPAHTV